MEGREMERTKSTYAEEPNPYRDAARRLKVERLVAAFKATGRPVDTAKDCTRLDWAELAFDAGTRCPSQTTIDTVIDLLETERGGAA
jgi:hypothetical protein